MGHWKGAGLALLLDLLAALLTSGQTTVQIGQQKTEYGVAQVFDYVTGPADHRVRIPIRGRAESLNLATAAAICLYASARVQHRVHGPIA